MAQNPEPHVFQTKSFWAPLVSGGVTWLATKIQPWIEITPDEQTALTGAVTVIVIAVVRAYTHRPARMKPKKRSQP